MNSHDWFLRRLASLDSLAKAALRSAALRHGVRDVVVYESFASVHRRGRPTASRSAYYLAALLFFWHPRTGAGASIGSGIRRLPDDAHPDRLLRALVSASEVSLQESLLAVVRSMARYGVPLSWNSVIDDLNEWQSNRRAVISRWASEGTRKSTQA